MPARSELELPVRNVNATVTEDEGALLQTAVSVGVVLISRAGWERGSE